MNKAAGSVILGLIIFVAAIALIAMMNNTVSIVDTHGNTKVVHNLKDVSTMKRILEKYTYDEDIENENGYRDNSDYQVTVSSKVYLIKAESNIVESGGKQTEITKEDMDELLGIIEEGNEETAEN